MGAEDTRRGLRGQPRGAGRIALTVTGADRARETFEGFDCVLVATGRLLYAVLFRKANQAILDEKPTALSRSLGFLTLDFEKMTQQTINHLKQYVNSVV